MSDPVAGPVTEAPPLPDGPYVFVTVGTDHHPFDRLVSWADRWSERSGMACFVQSGTSTPPDRSPGAAYVPYQTMAEAMRDAAAVVCHGGPATIMLARQCGTVPIVVPRDPDRGEHVDGHQKHFTAWMAAKGQVMAAVETSEIDALLARALDGDPAFTVSHDDAEVSQAVDRFSSLVDELLTRRGR